MTTGPTEEQCGTPEGGPDGMPAALGLSDVLGVLAPECEAELRCWDLYSERSDGAYAWIRSMDEGRYLFRVTLAVSPFDLKSALRYGREQHQSGEQHGRGALAHSLRALIGAAQDAERSS